MIDEICDIIKDNYDPFLPQKGSYDIHRAAKEIKEHITDFIMWIITDMKNEYKVTCVHTFGRDKWLFVKDDVFYNLNEVYDLWLVKQ